MTLSELISSIGGGTTKLCAPLGMLDEQDSIQITGVSTDTRTISSGEAFVALVGESFDGHNYIRSAVEQGALAVVVSNDRMELLPEFKAVAAMMLGVENTLTAYGEIASAWREAFNIPLIGVTGSVGKTTTKEMLAAALSPLGPILKTDKNENNEVGVPKLLLRLDESHKAAVVEMGMRGAGQIAWLAEIAEPTIGVISRIGENHVELLGSLDAIADAKGELIEALRADGLAVLNADDPYTPRLISKARCPVVTYGFTEGATLRAAHSRLSESGREWLADLVYTQDDGSYRLATLRVPSPSRHDVSNALAAVLTAASLGVLLQEACDALAEYKNVGMRMEIVAAPSGATILSDCYNAAPASMRSALDTLAEFPSSSGRRVAILGDMRELGEFAPQMHADVEAHAELLHLSEIYAVGSVSSAQMTRADRAFPDSEAAAAWAAESLSLEAGDVILVKGSRSLAMERVVEALTTPR